LLGEWKGTVLVFSRTKHGASKICRSVRAMGHNAAEIHSDRSLAQRRRALDGFKTGEFRVLVATDIAARGIDVKGIELVINYDLPDAADDYVHRIGRTGRAGAAGHAISFAGFDQKMDVKQIERLIRAQIPVSIPKDLPAARPKPVLNYETPAYAKGPQRFDERRVQDHKKSYGHKSYGGYNRSSGRQEDRKWSNNKPSAPHSGGRSVKIHT
jgi:superfamily II DNA/RNA helicase